MRDVVRPDDALTDGDADDADDAEAAGGVSEAFFRREERLRALSSLADFRARALRAPPAGGVCEGAGSGAGEGFTGLTSSPITTPFSGITQCGDW